MSTAPAVAPIRREPELLEQTVLVIAGRAGSGWRPPAVARAEDAEVILTGRDPERLEQVARELGALSADAFDATDGDAPERFVDGLPEPIDHPNVSGSDPSYASLPVRVGLLAVGMVRPGGRCASSAARADAGRVGLAARRPA